MSRVYVAYSEHDVKEELESRVSDGIVVDGFEVRREFDECRRVDGHVRLEQGDDVDFVVVIGDE
jgi:hypothetical protein